MKRLSIKNIFGLLLMLMLSTACVSTPPPRMGAEFGEALDMAKAQQTQNPDASLNTEPVIGIDGIASDAAFDSYRKSFTKAPGSASGGVEFGSSTGGGAQ